MRRSVFSEAAERFLDAYREMEGDNLAAVYVWGSAYRDEVSLGFSDLDVHAFVSGPPASDAYPEWRRRAEQQTPGIVGFSRPLPASLVAQNDALAFRLHWDAERLFGDDLLAGVAVPPADAAMARRLFPAVRDLNWFAVGRLSSNPTDFALPKETDARHRKMARLGVLGGAYWLMAQGRFRSYRGTDVLPELRASLPEWEALWRQTEEAYITGAPVPAESAERYAQDLADFLAWADAEIGPAA